MVAVYCKNCKLKNCKGISMAKKTIQFYFIVIYVYIALKMIGNQHDSYPLIAILTFIKMLKPILNTMHNTPIMHPPRTHILKML